MNDNISSIKNMAGEFALEAELAEKRGENKTARLFYQKAYAITKEHLPKIPSNQRYQLTRSIYASHAAQYALYGGLYKQAIQIAEKGLSSNPHEAFIPDLKSIIKKAKRFLKNESKSVTTKITGTLIGADLSAGTFKVLGQQDNQYYGIHTSKEQIIEIVKTFWTKQVEVIGNKIQDGTISLEKIKLAA